MSPHLPRPIDAMALDERVSSLVGRLGDDGAFRFGERVRTYAPVAMELLAELYPDHDLAGLERRSSACSARPPLAASGNCVSSMRGARSTRWFQGTGQIGYVAYAERFGGTLNGVRESPRPPRLDCTSPTSTSCTCCVPVTARTTAATRSSTTPTSNPDLGHAGRPATAGRRPARARHQPVPGRGDEPHARASTRGRWRHATVRPITARVLRVPRPHAARPVRAHAARGVPRGGARQLHLRRIRCRHGCGPRSTPTSGT